MSGAETGQVFADALLRAFGPAIALIDSAPAGRDEYGGPSEQVGNGSQPVIGLSREDCNSPARASRQLSSTGWWDSEIRPELFCGACGAVGCDQHEGVSHD